MKQLLLVMMFMIFVGCSSVHPKPEKTFLEKREETVRFYMKGQIDKNKAFTKRQKFLTFKFLNCFRDLIANPNTVRNLMDWQKKTLKTVATSSCLIMLKKEYGDISELLRVIN